VEISCQFFTDFNENYEVYCQVVRSGKLGTIEKTGAADLQTEADRAAQYCIRHSLATQFGARLRIIGEEVR
jgi:fructose-1,6-bisphosphatase/inositol monophosphatase family enzyme